MLGIDKSTISRAENAHSSAMLNTYQRCADALGVTLSEIFCDELTPDEAELLRVFRAIPRENHAQIIGLLRLSQVTAPPANTLEASR